MGKKKVNFEYLNAINDGSLEPLEVIQIMWVRIHSFSFSELWEEACEFIAEDDYFQQEHKMKVLIFLKSNQHLLKP